MTIGLRDRVPKLLHGLPLHVRHKAHFIIQQMRAHAKQPMMKYTPLRQLPAAFPAMPDEQLAAVALYILWEVGHLDSMSEMSEAESLWLQMAMQRHSKVMEILSNMLKLIDDTASGITQKIK